MTDLQKKFRQKLKKFYKSKEEKEREDDDGHEVNFELFLGGKIKKKPVKKKISQIQISITCSQEVMDVEEVANPETINISSSQECIQIDSDSCEETNAVDDEDDDQEVFDDVIEVVDSESSGGEDQEYVIKEKDIKHRRKRLTKTAEIVVIEDEESGQMEEVKEIREQSSLVEEEEEEEMPVRKKRRTILQNTGVEIKIDSNSEMLKELKTFSIDDYENPREGRQYLSYQVRCCLEENIEKYQELSLKEEEMVERRVNIYDKIFDWVFNCNLETFLCLDDRAQFFWETPWGGFSTLKIISSKELFDFICEIL